jgi:inner membrane transporter RhtA
MMNLSFYFALQRIPLGIAVALEFLGPLSVAIFSSKKKIDYLWAILAGTGIYLLLPVSGLEAQLDLIGILLAILSGVFWALYIIFGKIAGNNLKGEIASSMGMMFGALVVMPFGLAMDADKLFNLQALPMVLVVALFGSALPYTLEMLALKKLPQHTFGILMSLEPAIAALMGLLLLNESLTFLQSLAIGCVVASSLGSTCSNSPTF